MDEQTIVDSEGRKRKCVTVICDNCGAAFNKPKRFVKHGKNNFCNRECAGEFNNKQVTATCAICSVPVIRKRSNVSKSGLVFCCREHKELAQGHKYGKLLQCGDIGSTGVDYRALALALYGEKCEWCPETILKLLDVHHLDHDRSHNDGSNLIVLCVRCHALETRGLVRIEQRKPIAIGLTLEELFSVWQNH